MPETVNLITLTTGIGCTQQIGVKGSLKKKANWVTLPSFCCVRECVDKTEQRSSEVKQHHHNYHVTNWSDLFSVHCCHSIMFSQLYGKLSSGWRLASWAQMDCGEGKVLTPRFETMALVLVRKQDITERGHRLCVDPKMWRNRWWALTDLLGGLIGDIFFKLVLASSLPVALSIEKTQMSLVKSGRSWVLR